MHRTQKHNATIWKIWIAILYITLIVLTVRLAHADEPVLHRHDGPPTHEVPCSEHLEKLQDSMYRSSMAEATLAKRIGDTDNLKFFVMRAVTVKHTPDLKFSRSACSKENLTVMDAIDATWWYDYFLDLEHIAKQEEK